MEEIMQLLKTGKTAQSSTLGPMAAVVFSSTQHLSDNDLKAMAHYLKALPRQENAKEDRKPATPESQQVGHGIYHDQCAQCHGDNGEGRGDYPSLAGNRTVTMDSSVNLVRIILSGGFAPTTEGHPRPYGMPPFGHTLSDSEVAAVATYVRNAWGHNAGAVMPINVQKTR
jgi:mono/diheme cytochrome c family protein